MKKLLVGGDTHGRIEQVEYLLEVADRENCGAAFIVGDYGFWEHHPSGIEFNDEVNAAAADLGLIVYFLDGNHDKTSLILSSYKQRDDEGFIEVRPNLRYAPRGHRWGWGDTSFIALGGAYSVDKQYRLDAEAERSRKIAKRNEYWPATDQLPVNTSGTQWFPEEEMTDADMVAILAADPSPVDVILAHDKPRSSNLDSNRKDFLECYPNQDRLQSAVVLLKAKQYIHGHLHYRYEDDVRTGDDTWCHVTGLDCDPENATTPDHRPDNAWLILDL